MEVFGLPAGIFVQGGAVGLLSLTVWLIFTGRLVPRSAVDDIRADRDNWRQVALAKEETRQVEAAQNNVVLEELSATVDKFINSLPPPAGQRRRHPTDGSR